MDFERRVFATTELRAVASADGPVLEGLAARYNTRSAFIPDGRGGGFYEYIRSGAFTKVLANKPDVRCLFNHDPNVVLGRSTAGTLTLRETASGLTFRCLMPPTQAARDIHASVQRGDISQCSFSFMCDPADSDWDQEDVDGVRSVVRRIRNFTQLNDVSPVTFPAYADTVVSARSLVAAIRQRFPGGNSKCPRSVQESIRDLMNRTFDRLILGESISDFAQRAVAHWGAAGAWNSDTNRAAAWRQYAAATERHRVKQGQLHRRLLALALE